MRSIITFLSLLFSVYTLSAEAWITGRIKNATPGERIELYIPHHYIDNEGTDIKVQLDGQLQFDLRATLQAPQIAFLIYGQDQVPIFLEPNDTLVVRADMFQFPLGIEFGGRAGTNNQLLRDYLRTQTMDFNEFNNIRFKVGQWWFPVETLVNESMVNLSRESFVEWADAHQKASFEVYDRYLATYPERLSAAFRQWLETEVVFQRGYNLLMYGLVYKNLHQITDDFFEVLYELPLSANAIGSEAYRQYLQLFMAYKQVKEGGETPYYANQYLIAGELLEGQALAYLRSELIRMAFSSEHFEEILPYYQDYLRSNPYHEYEPKITTLYERTSRFAPGTVAPGYAGTDFYTALPFTNTSLLGKSVYLNFWASWCGACIKKMEWFEAFSAELEQAGVVVVNVSIDDNESNWRNALAEQRFPGLHLLAKAHPEQALANNFGVEAVPQYFIIDAKGKIAQKPYSGQPNDIKDRLLEVAKQD